MVQSRFCSEGEYWRIILLTLLTFLIGKQHATKTQSKLKGLLDEARLARKPLRLHNHRPLAIKMSIPLFEESYNPDKHYDPDRDRAEFSKLKAEHKRERKGALRELRKDSAFMARETLRQRKEKDAEYEKKQRRLLAAIQEGDQLG